MPIAESFAGTEAVGATEHSLPRDAAYDSAQVQTDDGVYQVFLDVSDMVATDVLQVRIYERVRSGDTQRLVYEAILTDAQAEPIFVTPPLLLLHGWDVTCDALAGTITVNWSIRRIS